MSRDAIRLLSMHSTQPVISAASLWEISIKLKSGKLALDDPFPEMVAKEFASNAYELLPIEPEHTFKLLQLPVLEHADPFDRMLAAQTLAEDIEILSADEKLDAYGVRRIW